MKDKVEVNIMREYAALRAKNYSYLMDDGNR